MQAGGHRFDPGTLHQRRVWKQALFLAPTLPRLATKRSLWKHHGSVAAPGYACAWRRLVTNPRRRPESLRPDARPPQANVVYGGYSTSKERIVRTPMVYRIVCLPRPTGHGRRRPRRLGAARVPGAGLVPRRRDPRVHGERGTPAPRPEPRASVESERTARLLIAPRASPGAPGEGRAPSLRPTPRFREQDQRPRQPRPSRSRPRRRSSAY